MKNEEIEMLIQTAIRDIIQNSSNNKNYIQMEQKHNEKIHFIPKKYRIFGGILQSMNIQFGNFIEKLTKLLIEYDGRYEIIEKYSGIRSNQFKLSEANDILIDRYITNCQLNNYDLNIEFPKLLNKIVNDTDCKFNTFKNDIDLLFKDKLNNKIYYLEIKYNDDHDTGKFVDINRKFIKTYAYLTKELQIKHYDELIPMLFFFNNKKLKGNIYVPEDTNIKRGKTFFKEFLNIEYCWVDEYITNLSESEENLKMFDELCKNIMK